MKKIIILVLVILGVPAWAATFANYYTTNHPIPTLNVIDYGAVADGIKDCTAAFQRAADAAVGGTNKPNRVFLPSGGGAAHNFGVGVAQPGKYFLSGTVIVTNNVEFVGELGNIIGATAILHTNSTPAFIVRTPFGGVTPVVFKNIVFGGNFFDTNNVGVRVEDGYFVNFVGCTFYYLGAGVVCSNQSYATFDKCLFECSVPLLFDNCPNFAVRDCDFTESLNGIRANGTGLFTVENSNFGGITHWNGNATNAFWLVGNQQGKFSNCKFNMPGQTNGTPQPSIFLSGSGNVNFDACLFRNDYGGSNLCVFSSQTEVSLINCRDQVGLWNGCAVGSTAGAAFNLIGFASLFSGSSATMTGGLTFSSAAPIPMTAMLNGVNAGNLTLTPVSANGQPRIFSFGLSYGGPSIYFYEGAAGSRSGIGTTDSGIEFFTDNANAWMFGGGGNYNTPPANEWARITSSSASFKGSVSASSLLLQQVATPGISRMLTIKGGATAANSGVSIGASVWNGTQNGGDIAWTSPSTALNYGGRITLRPNMEDADNSPTNAAWAEFDGSFHVAGNFFVPNGTARIANVNITSQLSHPTNAAPTSVTLGVTVPDYWIKFKAADGTTDVFVPGWKNH